MFSKRAHVFNDSSSEVRGNFFGIYGVLIAINILTWVWAIAAFRHHPVLLGSALLPSNLRGFQGCRR
jgi:nickel/cobalt transporter (NiCoT) family protein